MEHVGKTKALANSTLSDSKISAPPELGNGKMTRGRLL